VCPSAVLDTVVTLETFLSYLEQVHIAVTCVLMGGLVTDGDWLLAAHGENVNQLGPTDPVRNATNDNTGPSCYELI
jgi:hypothetical protein